MSVILSLKELLNVSSDWLDVKSKPLHGGTGGGPSSGSTSVGTNQGSVPADFQSTQIERIIDNLCLAMPSRGQNIQFHDSDIKELSYDLGVDPRILKFRLQ